MTRNAIGAAVIAMLMALTSAANAAWYAKFDGVDGSSKAEDHDGWVELHSVQFPTSGPAALPRGSGNLVMTSSDAKALPKLYEFAVKGKVFKQVKVFQIISAGKDSAQKAFELRHVFISSYQTGGSGGGQLVLSYRSLAPIEPDAPAPAVVPPSLTDDGEGEGDSDDRRR